MRFERISEKELVIMYRISNNVRNIQRNYRLPW